MVQHESVGNGARVASNGLEVTGSLARKWQKFSMVEFRCFF